MHRLDLFSTICCALLTISATSVVAQDKAPATQEKTTPAQNKTAAPEKPAAAQEKPAGLNVTAEQVAESSILAYGSRVVLNQIRRNGLEHGKVTRTTPEGRIEEATYDRRFIRGDNATKDKVRLDEKMPTLEYSLIYGDGRLWGIINGTAFTPKQETASSFLTHYWHTIDALLRYKENESTISLVGKDKQKGIDLYVLDLEDKEKRKTRYYISAHTLHVLWLEYEESPLPGSSAVKYTRKFFDYRIAQSTIVPYRTVLLANDKQIEETRILSVTYGLRLEDSIFQNPDVQANSNP